MERKERVLTLRVEDIRPNPHQPRQTFDDEGLRELASSIRHHGILQPLTVRSAGSGKWELDGEQLTVYAPDDITLNRLDNDRVKGVLSEEAGNAAGTAVRLLLRVGEPPKASPEENLKNLLKFGSQFDNIEIK